MMSVALKTPKNYNRIYLMNLGTKEEEDWKPITVGIAATETEIEEESEDYYYMDGRGTPVTANWATLCRIWSLT